MKTKILLLLLISTIMFGCREQCEKDNTGTYQFINNTNDPISIELDGIYFSYLSAWSNTTRELKSGTHTVRAEQESGYILYPDVWENTIYVTACSERSLTYQ